MWQGLFMTQYQKRSPGFSMSHLSPSLRGKSWTMSFPGLLHSPLGPACILQAPGGH